MSMFFSVLVSVALAANGGVTLVENGAPKAVVVLPEHAEPIAAYAAQELVYHIKRASGAELVVVHEPLAEAPKTAAVYVGATAAAEAAGVNPQALKSEETAFKTVDGNLYIVGQDRPGDPLSTGNTHSGTLWGVYEVLERNLGVRWLWPGELGEYIPQNLNITLPELDEHILPRFEARNLRPGLGLRGFTEGDPKLGFSPEASKRYAQEQTVFLRRQRMGESAGSFFSQRSSGGGHSFGGWWEKYGAEHPEWFQQLANGKRGPEDPAKPNKVTMCVSNPGLHAKIVELWQEERAKHPGEPVNIDTSENDESAECVCDQCRAWDDPAPDPATLPAGLERSYLPVQAGARYARFVKSVYELAAKTDPNVKVNYYAYLNYFWAPQQDIQLSKNIYIAFVPWFRWAGWFPRTEAEQEFIKQQWLGWEKTGASVYYRPNWFLDGYTMPLVYMHQFADAFQFYAKHGMIGTNFDTLQGQWAAQGPNLYLLARLHVRPETPVDTLLNEYYAAFGPAAKEVKAYFDYWEDYAVKNSPRAADAIRKRADGRFRRYAKYAQVADELYPQEVFAPAEALLDKAREAAQGGGDPIAKQRVEFLTQGLAHAKKCAATAAVINSAGSSLEEKKTALAELATARRTVEGSGIANMDRAAIIETDGWKEIQELFPLAP